MTKIKHISEYIYFIAEIEANNCITNEKIKYIGSINKNEQSVLIEDSFVQKNLKF